MTRMRGVRKSGWMLAAILALASVSDGARAAASAEWTTPGGDLQGTRFSDLTEITTRTVGKLVEDFAVPTGVKASHQGSPLVVGSVMYVVTPFPNRLIAIDLAKKGAILWTFEPGPDDFARGVSCCDVINRGAAYASGKVVYNLLDGSTVAVDAQTGKQIWRKKIGDPRTGETMSGAPLIVKDKVIVGNAGAELGVRGWIQALDLNTGKSVWKAYSTGPDSDTLMDRTFRPPYAKDAGINLGTTSWGGSSLWQQGGGTAWGWVTYDPIQKRIFYGTAQPGVWNADLRPGRNQWASSIIARDPDTGRAAWAYQVTPHDGWDYDSVNENIAVTLPIGGVNTSVLVHFDKNGFAYTLQRQTGKLLVAKPFTRVTWATGVNLSTGEPQTVAEKATHQGAITTDICPSALGGKDWEPASFSPQTRLFYVPAINLCQDLEPLAAIYIAGTPFTGADVHLKPGAGGYLGELVAWDATAGQRAWSVQEKFPLYGGTLSTAGGVVFYGTLDGWFKAVDAKTGKLLFSTKLECGVVSNPISFTGPDGKQRIAVMTGVGWLAGGLSTGACPAGGGFTGSSTPIARAVQELPQADRAPLVAPPTSGFIHVFKLP